MNLADALDIRPRDVVAFVGAGGKTSAMFRLASELAGQGWRVVSTTTTRIAQEELSLAPQRIGFGHGMRLPESLPEQLAQHRHVFVFTKIEADDKVRGVRPAWLDEHLAQASYLDVLLVEADGSRRLPMKAPLPHEPAVPRSATIVVPVVGLDALGQPLDEMHIYGAETMHRFTGHALGSPITPRVMASVLIHPQLGLKGAPSQARVIPLLNKVTAESLNAARTVADYSLTDLNIERVLIGALHDDNPIWETRRRVGAVVLAAGESRRMGQPKVLLPWGNSTIIRRVCEQVAESNVYEVVVIAGRWEDEIRTQIGDLPVRVIFNPLYAEGEMLSSLRVGLEAIWHTSDACMVVLGDQPSIQQSVIQEVIDSYFQGRGRIVVPSYQSERGHPLLIDRAFWQSFMELPAGAAPRDAIRANEDQVFYIHVKTDSILRDIDTPDDYEQARLNM